MFCIPRKNNELVLNLVSTATHITPLTNLKQALRINLSLVVVFLCILFPSRLLHIYVSRLKLMLWRPWEFANFWLALVKRANNTPLQGNWKAHSGTKIQSCTVTLNLWLLYFLPTSNFFGRPSYIFPSIWLRGWKKRRIKKTAKKKSTKHPLTPNVKQQRKNNKMPENKAALPPSSPLANLSIDFPATVLLLCWEILFSFFVSFCSVETSSVIANGNCQETGVFQRGCGGSGGCLTSQDTSVLSSCTSITY